MSCQPWLQYHDSSNQNVCLIAAIVTLILSQSCRGEVYKPQENFERVNVKLYAYLALLIGKVEMHYLF